MCSYPSRLQFRAQFGQTTGFLLLSSCSVTKGHLAGPRGRLIIVNHILANPLWPTEGSLVQGAVHEWARIPEGLEFRQLRKGYAPTRYVISGGDGGKGIEAMIDFRASPEDRQHAFDLNLQCMWTLRGYPDMRSLMPSVWNDSQEYLLQHTPPTEP